MVHRRVQDPFLDARCTVRILFSIFHQGSAQCTFSHELFYLSGIALGCDQCLITAQYSLKNPSPDTSTVTSFVLRPKRSLISYHICSAYSLYFKHFLSFLLIHAFVFVRPQNFRCALIRFLVYRSLLPLKCSSESHSSPIIHFLFWTDRWIPFPLRVVLGWTHRKNFVRIFQSLYLRFLAVFLVQKCSNERSTLSIRTWSMTF